MQSVNVVAIETVPDVIAGERGHGPMISLADHLLSHVILPFCPGHLGVRRQVLVEDDNRELQRSMCLRVVSRLRLPLTLGATAAAG